MMKLMCFSARMELLRSVQMKYHDASRSEKAKILDGFVAALIMIVNMRFGFYMIQKHQYLQDNVVHLKDRYKR